MSEQLQRWGRYAARRPWRVIAAWVVLTAAVVGAGAVLGRDLEPNPPTPGLDSTAATELLSGAGSDEAGLGQRVVVTPAAPGATFHDSPAARRDLAELRAEVLTLTHVLAASDPLAADSPGLSPDGRVALLQLHYPVLSELSVADLEQLTAVVEEANASAGLRVEQGGDLSWEFAEAESATGEVVGVVVAGVVLLLAFGSLLAAGLPLATALLGLGVSMGSMALVTYLVEIPDWVPPVAAMIGLGVGIDYALFLQTRFREGLLAGLDVPTALGRALATAGRAVVFAGGTVTVAILGLAVAGIPFVTAAGVAISVAVLVMVLAAITLLPALLGLAGTRVLGRRTRRRLAAGAAAGTTLTPARVPAGWLRWGRHLERHPWPWAVAGTVALLALAAPVTALQLGNPDQGTYPAERTERRAHDLVSEGFGPGANGPLVIAVDAAADPEAVPALVDAVAADPGVASVTATPFDPHSGVVALTAVPTTTPQAGETATTVQRLRTEVLPGVLADSPARAHVGGQTASVADLADQVERRLPWFVGAVVLLSLVLLTFVFRSVVVPLKAALLNLLSVGAAYGVLVMVFQWGWGASLIGLESTLPVISFIPLFMFAILFGLSMDYEVFLLSRVREAWRRTGDTSSAVVEGLATTGRTITAAALIMVAVFGGFVLGNDPVVKMFGLGLATAIVVDVTVVRLVLVPSWMRLLGKANWWLPAWLERLLPVEADEPFAELPLDTAGDPAQAAAGARQVVTA